ncbi:MAG: hypothetical protein HYX38_28960 [Rhodospirillales bacterium]|nr:hypothetical protein [Rhodospirillales bacterium]
MNAFSKGLIVVAAISLPALAQAQSSDAAYCKALVDKYEHYLDMGSKRGRQPQSLESRMSIAQCQAGDPSGIPGLEKALADAKLGLPSRTVEPEKAAASVGDCGIEAWSTDKMMYVGMPCK